MVSKAEPYWCAGSSENGVRGSLRSLKRRVAALPAATAREILREREELEASSSGSDSDPDTNTAQADASHGGGTFASPDGKVGAAPDKRATLPAPQRHPPAAAHPMLLGSDMDQLKGCFEMVPMRNFHDWLISGRALCLAGKSVSRLPSCIRHRRRRAGPFSS